MDINTIKKHLNIDEEFNGDNDYLLMLADVAKTAVEKHIDCNLEDLQNESGEIPTPLSQAILLMIGNLYMNRESVAFNSVVEVPKSYDYLLSLYKDYTKKYENGGTF